MHGKYTLLTWQKLYTEVLTILKIYVPDQLIGKGSNYQAQFGLL